MDTELGKRIEQWRIGRGLTRPALGRKLNPDTPVNGQTIYGWERLGTPPNEINRAALEREGFHFDHRAAA